MTEVNLESRVGVFFDYENIVYSLRNRFEQKANFDALIEKCKEFGRVATAQAFADWGLPYMSSALMYALQSSGFELIFVPTGSTQSNAPRKNVADLYMAIAVMDTLYNRPDIDTYVLLTGDRDFMVLVNHLKQQGKRVVAIGVDGSSSYYLTQAVDDFYYYSEVEEIFEDQPKRQKGRPTNIYDALQQAIQVMREKGRTPRLTNIKPVMVELMGTFDEKSYTDSKGRNFQKFKDFVQEAQRRGTVRLLRRGNTIEVHLPEENIDNIRRRKPADDGADDSIKLDLAYKLLVKAIGEVATKGRNARVGSVRNRMKKLLPSFSVASIEADEGDFPFGKFDDFVATAADAGLVTVSGEGSRMEIALVATEGDDAVEEADTTVDAVSEDAADDSDDTEEKAVNAVDGDEARAAILAAIRAYQNYPTSFLSLAGFVHRHNDSVGIAVGEVEARDLMTEAVKSTLLNQIVLDDGRRQYELNDSAELVTSFLGQEDVAEVESIEDEPGVESTEEAAAPVAATFATPYDALVEAVGVILQSGKDPVLPRVKSTMVNLMGSFSEKELTDSDGNNFVKFKDFVIDAEKRGYVRLQIDGSINRVFLAEGRAEASDAADATASESVTDDAMADGESADDIADAVASAIADAASKAIDEGEGIAQEAPAPVQVEEEEKRAVGEPEQRQLVVDALTSFTSYPAPFMGILAHCRSVRNEKEMRITSGDLRDLLSETVRIGLVNAVESNRRPTRYAYSKNAELAQQYVDQTVVEEVEEAVEALVESAEAPAAVAVEAPVAKPAAKPAPVVAAPAGASDAELRQLIVDVVSTLDIYPAPYANVLKAIVSEQKARGLDATDKRLRDNLSAATRGNVLSITTPRGVRPTKYAFVDDADAIAAYHAAVAPVEVEEVPAVVEAAPVAVEEAAPEAAAPAQIDTTGMPEEVAALITVVQEMDAAGKDALLGNVKKAMKKHIKGFDEKRYNNADGQPFKKFKDFVANKIVDAGLAELVKSGRTARIVLNAVETAPAPVVEAETVVEVAEPVVEVAEETAAPAVEPSELEKAFGLLVQAVTDATAVNSSRKLPSLKTRMEKLDSNVDIKQLKDAGGKPFRGMGTFARAAEAAGLVVVAGKGMKIEVSLP